jgi:hypothetical protein
MISSSIEYGDFLRPVASELMWIPALSKQSDAPAVVVEPERSASVLGRVQNDFIVTTWPGNARAISKADFTPLTKRTVYLWPDNDPTGRAAMRTVVLGLRKLVRRLVRLEPQANWFVKRRAYRLKQDGSRAALAGTTRRGQREVPSLWLSKNS